MEAAYLKAKHEDMQNELAKLKRKADMLNNIPVNQTPFQSKFLQALQNIDDKSKGASDPNQSASEI